jgi:hypothetical protein
MNYTSRTIKIVGYYCCHDKYLEKENSMICMTVLIWLCNYFYCEKMFTHTVCPLKSRLTADESADNKETGWPGLRFLV